MEREARGERAGFWRDPGAACGRGVRLHRPRLGGVGLRPMQWLDRGAARPALGRVIAAAAREPGKTGRGRACGRDGQFALGVRRTLSRCTGMTPVRYLTSCGCGGLTMVGRDRMASTPSAERPGLRLAGRLQPRLQAGDRQSAGRNSCECKCAGRVITHAASPPPAGCRPRVDRCAADRCPR